MKSAYELAMERLNKQSPSINLTDEQRNELAELDSKYAAKIAEREIFLTSELEKAAQNGDYEALEQIRKQFSSEKKGLQEELETKKEQVRNRQS